jgi:hypothetical protein
MKSEKSLIILETIALGRSELFVQARAFAIIQGIKSRKQGHRFVNAGLSKKDKENCVVLICA